MTRNCRYKGVTLSLAILAAVALVLTGCGRKGPLERPKSAKAAQHNYDPAPDATVRGPRKPFILDRLLR